MLKAGARVRLKATDVKIVNYTRRSLKNFALKQGQKGGEWAVKSQNCRDKHTMEDFFSRTKVEKASVQRC